MKSLLRFPDAKLTPNGKWKFAYNPCTSFTLGSWGDCHHDVAICMWTQSSYENIGKQSTAKFVLRKNGKVHIEYKNERKYPTWTNKVYLICDPNKTNIEPTNFKVKSINDGRNNRIFHLVHRCACPDVCPISTESPPTRGSKEKVALPVGITAACVFVIAVAGISVWIYRKRQPNNNPPMPPLIDNQEGGCRNYDSTNNFIGQSGKKEGRQFTKNKKRTCINEKGTSASCDITVPRKDDQYETGRASAPV